MSSSFDFDEIDFLTVGTLGPKGQRVFYLQCRASGELGSFKLEKQQVAALAEYLDRIGFTQRDGDKRVLADRS